MNIQYLEQNNKPELAYIYIPAREEGAHLPTVMFCGGFRSDMMGTKAAYFEDQCRQRGQAYLRFDYSGHGNSGGDFKDGTIGAWFEDSLAVFDAVIDGPVIIVGSSMGGWIGLLLAQKRAERVKGLIGIAAAPDFTERLYREELSEEQRVEVESQGYVEIPNEYSEEPYIFTKALFEDGKLNFVLDRDQNHGYPIMLFHGLLDSSVPETVPLAIKKRYSGGAFDIAFIEDGDHRLSRPQDLEMIGEEISAMSKAQA